MLLSIDPGLRKIGWCLWRDDYLHTAGLSQTPGTRERDARQWLAMASALWADVAAEHITRVAYEMPQIYDEQDNRRMRKLIGAPLRNAVNPDNLLQLAGVLGACLVPWMEQPLVALRPRQWKRPGVTKRQTQATLKKTLTPGESLTLKHCLQTVPQNCHHDVYDAVSIGLWVLRR